MKTDVAIIGGGPAGLAAAIEAKKHAKVTLIERNEELGGILQQCIHHGFGNFIFGEALTGPEYAEHFIEQMEGVDVMLNTTVLEIDKNKRMLLSSPDGVFEMEAKAIILAMGCRERTRTQIFIPGTRPAGIYTAGTAQRLINIEGVMLGKHIVILGSGDVGLIMARRLTLEGAKVEGVYEIMPKPGGLTRNIVQCLYDFDIPLHLSHTIVEIVGKRRVEGVFVAKVDENFKPIEETKRFVPCDTLILAVGLIPENELTKKIGIELDDITAGPVVDEGMETSIEGIFACGNVVHVHDLVDDVSFSAIIAGREAAKYANGRKIKRRKIKVKAGENVRYVVPQIINGRDMEEITFYFRVKKEMKNVVTRLIVDGEVRKEKRELIVKPPEMVRLKVKGELVKNANSISIEVKKVA
ncbi:MAG: FAD-dependent oxidoreductase [Thermoplasmata archaeon]|nr:MAG: FAD-dependent oxidoreductase [Thermoplasmata archaeon]